MTLVKDVVDWARGLRLSGDENLDGETGVWLVLVGEEMVEELGWVCGESVLEGGRLVTFDDDEDKGEEWGAFLEAEEIAELGEEEFLREELEYGFEEGVWGDEDGGIWRLPHSPSTLEESRRSPSEAIKPSDTNQDLEKGMKL